MKKKNTTWSVIKQYGKKSVFFRYVVGSFSICLLVFLPLIFLIFTYYNYVLTQELSRQSTITALQSKNLFESLTTDFHTNYMLACNSEDVLDFLLSPAADGELIQKTRSFIQDRLDNSDLPDEIFIYSFRNEYSVSSGENIQLGKRNNYEWYRTYRSTKLPFIIFPRQDENGNFTKLYICNEIYRGGELIGLFCTEMNYQRFVSIIRDSFVTQPDEIFVVSTIGLILYCDTPELINTQMFEKSDTYAAFRAATNVEGNSIIYDDYIIAVAKSSQSELMIMSYVQKDTIQNSYQFIYVVLLGSSFAILVISLLLALLFSFRQYRSVAEVMNTLDEPHKLQEDKGLLNEFFYIANSISDISQRNASISNELSEKMYLLKNAQIAALQAQINPHFLFNTLQLISLSIIKEVKRDNMATYLIHQLSSLVRTAYDTEKYIVTVEEELETTQMYLNIQQARYKSQLQIEVDAEPECLEYKTIKLILQPLVENCILHGFKGKEGLWHIRIRCYVEREFPREFPQEFLVYRIEDDGWGIGARELESLNAILQSDRIDRNEKVGISNVNQRLKLVFGRKCGIEVSSKEGQGTVILMRHYINSSL